MGGVGMSDLKMDDEVVITIRARVYDVVLDRSDRADRLAVLLYGGKKYWLATDPGSVAIAKVEPAPAEAAAAPVETRVSDERIQEILDGLNGFVVHEYETESNIVNGRAVHSRVSVGCDFNLDKAVDWALDQSEVSIACGPDTDGGAEIELSDGTTIEWIPAEKSWAVTVSDDTEAGESRIANREVSR